MLAVMVIMATSTTVLNRLLGDKTGAWEAKRDLVKPIYLISDITLE